MKSSDIIATALANALSNRPLSYTTARLAATVAAALKRHGFAIVPVVPTVEMLAAVVQQVGDPSPEAWALAERAVGGTLGLPNMAGEQACAELVRDWQNMIEATEPQQ
jgi:hypothetical protein